MAVGDPADAGLDRGAAQVRGLALDPGGGRVPDRDVDLVRDLDAGPDQDADLDLVPDGALDPDPGAG